MVRRTWTAALVLGLLTTVGASGAATFEGVISLLEPGYAEVTITSGEAPAVGAAVAAPARALLGSVYAAEGRLIGIDIAQPWPTLLLGERLRFGPPDAPVAEPAAAPVVSGPIVTTGAADLAGDSEDPTVAEALARQDRDVRERPRTMRTAADRMVSGDAPLMRAFEALASRGIIADASRRLFAGHGVTTYTRLELARLLVPTIETWRDRTPAETGLLDYVLGELADELRTLDVDPGRERAHLRAGGWNVLPSVSASGQLGTGDDRFRSRGRASVFVTPTRNSFLTGTLSTESLGAFPTGRDRTTLDTFWAEWRPSSKLRLGAGRAQFRLGQGFHDMLWSDYARVPDRLEFNWETLVFGRPFRYERHVGRFADPVTKYVMLHRLEYQPTRMVTIAGTEALISQEFAQAVAGSVLPLYATRFVLGEGRRGGFGNYLGSLEATVRPGTDWAFYGSFFADDFDFSPAPPKTKQRIGYQLGVLYTPGWALPGSHYRFEWTSIPYAGTYFGQQDRELAWSRGGYTFGHPYLDDSMGWRIELEHRLSRRVSLGFDAEGYQQRRGEAVRPSMTVVGLNSAFDLTSRTSIGIGWRWQQRLNIGEVAGRHLDDHHFYFETRFGY